MSAEGITERVLAIVFDEHRDCSFIPQDDGTFLFACGELMPSTFTPLAVRRGHVARLVQAEVARSIGEPVAGEAELEYDHDDAPVAWRTRCTFIHSDHDGPCEPRTREA